MAQLSGCLACATEKSCLSWQAAQLRDKKTSKTVKLQSLCIVIQQRILFVCKVLADFFVGHCLTNPVSGHRGSRIAGQKESDL
ncbi:MAG TPA: hypothetical protein ENI07_06520 [Desulfobacterales bacterium]|nr:hypothetical protein [Desulfobacterales bacterium]